MEEDIEAKKRILRKTIAQLEKELKDVKKDIETADKFIKELEEEEKKNG